MPFIAYHGTNDENARSIQRTGFRPGTYFARHLEDALGYGGEYVFEVAFKGSVGTEAWQFTMDKTIPAAAIVRLTHYGKTSVLFDNTRLREAVFDANDTASPLHPAAKHPAAKGRLIGRWWASSRRV